MPLALLRSRPVYRSYLRSSRGGLTHPCSPLAAVQLSGNPECALQVPEDSFKANSSLELCSEDRRW